MSKITLVPTRAEYRLMMMPRLSVTATLDRTGAEQEKRGRRDQRGHMRVENGEKRLVIPCVDAGLGCLPERISSRMRART